MLTCINDACLFFAIQFIIALCPKSHLLFRHNSVYFGQGSGVGSESLEAGLGRGVLMPVIHYLIHYIKGVGLLRAAIAQIEEMFA